MPAIVSLTNYLESLTPVNAPASAAGYASSDPTNPLLAHSWRANAAAASYTFDYNLGSVRALQFFAFFDVEGVVSGPAQLDHVEIWFDNAITFAATVKVADVFPNERGDGFLAGLGLSKQYIRIVYVMKSAAEIGRVGLPWFGSQLSVGKQFSEMEIDPLRETVLNETDGGAVFATQWLDYRHHILLTWSALRKGQRDSLKAIIDATQGAFKPFVIVPDPISSPLQVFHVRVTDSFKQRQDGRTVQGISYVATESGRAL
jgi:hypothetical protein